MAKLSEYAGKKMSEITVGFTHPDPGVYTFIADSFIDDDFGPKLKGYLYRLGEENEPYMKYTIHFRTKDANAIASDINQQLFKQYALAVIMTMLPDASIDEIHNQLDNLEEDILMDKAVEVTITETQGKGKHEGKTFYNISEVNPVGTYDGEVDDIIPEDDNHNHMLF